MSRIFEEKPNRWGLRGDPYLWDELSASLGNRDMPGTPEELRELLENEYKSLTGRSICYKKNFLVERYMHGGMSSGYISPGFWSSIAIPLLVSRHMTK